MALTDGHSLAPFSALAWSDEILKVEASDDVLAVEWVLPVDARGDGGQHLLFVRRGHTLEYAVVSRTHRVVLIV